MTTMRQFEEGNLSNGLLPPLRELLLEIQVNKLIKEYLFSSTTDERATSLCDVENGSSEYKVRYMPPWRSACDAPLLQSVGALSVHTHKPHSLHKSIGALDTLHLQSLHEPHSIACIDDTNSPCNPQSLPVVNAKCDVSLVMENELLKASHLSRVDTFPCAKKVELQVGAPHKADTEVKSTCKKPPRPPRLQKLPSNELVPNLTRCFSDPASHLQTSRRVKLERKRKATAGSSGNTSIWALLFTVCFAIIMIAQGFLSEDSQGYATYGNDASSPIESNMKPSTLVAPGEVRLAGADGGQQVSGIEGLPVQSYVMRKVQAQHVLDMKHLELDAFPKS